MKKHIKAAMAPVSLPGHPDVKRLYDTETRTIFVNINADPDAKIYCIIRPASPDDL